MTNPAYEMTVFERVAERGSFAAAAQDVDLSPSAVSKLIARLEHRLGVRLIHRTTRRLALTAEGATFLKRSREILASIDAAETEIASSRASPRGHLRVHAPPLVIGEHVGPDLADFLARYPRITVEFLVGNRAVDLIAENVDVAIRIGPLPDSTLIASKVIDLAQVVCASPGYLDRHGRPLLPADLKHHACLILTTLPRPSTWLFEVDGTPMTVEVSGPASADTADVLVRLAIAGVGIVRLGELAVARAIMQGTLEPVLQHAQAREAYPLWAVMPPGRQRSPKVRAFLDFLAERLGRAPWRANAQAVVTASRGRGR